MLGLPTPEVHISFYHETQYFCAIFLCNIAPHSACSANKGADDKGTCLFLLWEQTNFKVFWQLFQWGVLRHLLLLRAIFVTSLACIPHRITDSRYRRTDRKVFQTSHCWWCLNTTHLQPTGNMLPRVIQSKSLQFNSEDPASHLDPFKTSSSSSYAESIPLLPGKTAPIMDAKCTCIVDGLQIWFPPVGQQLLHGILCPTCRKDLFEL